MAEILIELPPPTAVAYPVYVGALLLSELGWRVNQCAPSPSCALVTDDHVATHYLGNAKAALESAGYRVCTFVFPHGESNKTLRTVAAAYDVLLSARLERSSPVIALGGGVTGDLAGFVSATLLRGVPFIQVPTTLLAAVDASVGGKVGVDHAMGKNLIGAFHQPRAVFTDVTTFRTLPPLEMQCGLAECVKHAVIRDAKLFDFLDRNISALRAHDLGTLMELVAWNVRIKAAVVMADPFERGERALLNLGHTFGHALETLAGYANLAHGQAVALGTVAACHLAAQRGEFPSASALAVESLLTRIGLPVRTTIPEPMAVIQAMGSDKKIVSGRLRLILPSQHIGQARIAADIPEAQILEAITYLQPHGASAP
ncbi:MAG: 3-dehydroquinate synthase [Phycisphaerae bacterium]